MEYGSTINQAKNCILLWNMKIRLSKIYNIQIYILGGNWFQMKTVRKICSCINESIDNLYEPEQHASVSLS